jgi:hypothetical protein
MKKLILILIPLIVLSLSLVTLACSSGGGGEHKMTATNGDQIYVIKDVCPMVCGGFCPSEGYSFHVELIPNSSARAGYANIAHLYEKGSYRALTHTMFTQPQIDLGLSVFVCFPATEEEYNNYSSVDPSRLWRIFSVQVY